MYLHRQMSGRIYGKLLILSLGSRISVNFFFFLPMVSNFPTIYMHDLQIIQVI